LIPEGYARAAALRWSAPLNGFPMDLSGNPTAGRLSVTDPPPAERKWIAAEGRVPLMGAKKKPRPRGRGH
jgi:hypothetical protein